MKEIKSVRIRRRDLNSGTLDIKVVVYDSNGASSETTTQIISTLPSPSEAIAALSVSQQGSITVQGYC